MTTEDIKTCYKEIKKKVVGSCDSGNAWTDKSNANANLLVTFIQVFSDITAITLSSTALVAYPVYTIFLSILARIKQWFTGDGDTLESFLPVCRTQEPLGKEKSGEDKDLSLYEFKSSMTVPLENSARVAADSLRKERKMRTFH